MSRNYNLPLENLKLLKADMESKGWFIDRFRFEYENTQYVVLVKLYTRTEVRNRYALLKLDFLREGSLDDHLEIPANAKRLLTAPDSNVSVKALRMFFDIEYGKDLGDKLAHFTVLLGKRIPDHYIEKCSADDDVKILLKVLAKSDSEDPNKFFCYKIRRNPPRKDGSPGMRSEYNDNKTRLLRSKLYKKLGCDWSISFCYSDKASEECSDTTIIERWSKDNKST